MRVKRWKKFTVAEMTDIVTLYREGLKLDLIAERHKRDRQTIRCAVKRSGVPRCPRYWSTYYLGPGRRSDFGPVV